MQPQEAPTHGRTSVISRLLQAKLYPAAQHCALLIAFVVLLTSSLPLSRLFYLFKLGFWVLSFLHKVPFGEPWPS